MRWLLLLPSLRFNIDFYLALILGVSMAIHLVSGKLHPNLPQSDKWYTSAAEFLFLILNSMGIIKMRKVTLFLCLILSTLTAQAEILACDALQARVDAKLQAKGVTSYTLEIVPIENPDISNNPASAVPPTKTPKGKEVGTCDGGTKRLMYTKGN